MIGYPVSTADAAAVFDRLGMPHETADEDRVHVEIPGYRVDLEREVDLIEEVARIQGYERIGSTLPPGLAPKSPRGSTVRSSSRTKVGKVVSFTCCRSRALKAPQPNSGSTRGFRKSGSG